MFNVVDIPTSVNTIILAVLGLVGTLGGAKIMSQQHNTARQIDRQDSVLGHITFLVNSNLETLKNDFATFKRESKEQVLALEGEVLAMRKQVLEGGGTRSDLPPTIMRSELLAEERTQPIPYPEHPHDGPEAKMGGT